jgi:hypothetical protein
MPRSYIPSSHDHYRLVDQMARVIGYAYEREDFGPIPSDCFVVEHLARSTHPAIADCPAMC